jgi:hypothetical protein
MVEANTERAFVRSADVISSQTADTTVALYIESGDCYAFSGPSARIWELLEKPISPSQTVAALMREFTIAEDACRAEVQAYFAKLEREGLVKAVDSGS